MTMKEGLLQLFISETYMMVTFLLSQEGFLARFIYLFVRGKGVFSELKLSTQKESEGNFDMDCPVMGRWLIRQIDLA